MSRINRRFFLRASAAGVTALAARRVLGANERIRVGLIGFGLIGRFHLAALKAQPDVQVTAVCDVHRGRVEAAAEMAAAMGVYETRFAKGDPAARCILCAQCVRTCREVVGVSAISMAMW